MVTRINEQSKVENSMYSMVLYIWEGGCKYNYEYICLKKKTNKSGAVGGSVG